MTNGKIEYEGRPKSFRPVVEAAQQAGWKFSFHIDRDDYDTELLGLRVWCPERGITMSLGWRRPCAPEAKWRRDSAVKVWNMVPGQSRPTMFAWSADDLSGFMRDNPADGDPATLRLPRIEKTRS